MKPVHLRINNYYSPLGIDTNVPILGWQLDSTAREQHQSYYRIIFAEQKKDIEQYQNLLWDSGKVSSSEQFGIPYEGQQLKSVTTYYWRVAVWNQHGKMCWSDPVSLFTGYLYDETWRANWIGKGDAKPFYARNEFSAKGNIKRAYALVSGLGHFKLFMNGQKVGPNEMDPGWTHYEKSVQYVCFDVTNHIREGTNVIGLSVGNGFYAGDAGDRHFYTIGKGYESYGSELLVIGEWHIEYEDNSIQYVQTESEQWKVCVSATTLANVYGSENFDARLYPEGWYESAFDDSTWSKAKVVVSPKGKLVSQNQPPIIVESVYNTIRIEEPKDQIYVFDLGQNMSGMFEIYVSGPAGSKVTIKPGELRNEDGTVATPWDIVTYSEYTLSGTGELETWKPDFSCFGARWVQIEGCTRDRTDPSKPFIHDVKGHFVTSASPDAGHLETDDSRITKLGEIIIKAIESNLQSVHSDCPTIEKLGWIETASLMGPSIMYVKAVEELWLKITRDMIEAQTEEGLIPDIAPEYSKFTEGFRDSIAWGSAIILVPELLLQTYGNRTALEEAYPAMKKYLNYLRLKEVDGGLIQHGLGDWGIAPQSGGDYIENVEMAFYYECYTLVSKFASMLGLDDESAYYKSESARVKRCYNAKLLRQVTKEGRYAYCKLNGEFDPLNQVVQAIPLYFKLVEEEYRSDVEAALLQATSGRQLKSGEIGLRFLFGALAGMKRNDIVFDMMMQPEHPSYIRFVECGETALPEFWTDDSRSRNHDMMGHILEWLYKELLGISSLSDAYKEILIAPGCLDRIQYASGSHCSIRGKIQSEFKLEGRGYQLTVTIPPNTRGRVKLPVISDQAVILEEGIPIPYDYVQEHGRPYAIIGIQSGSYRFTVDGL